MLYLFAAEVSRAVCAQGAAVLREAEVAAAIALGRVVVVATVILSGDRFTLKHGVELGGTLQRRHTFTTSGREKREQSGFTPALRI